MNNSNGFNSISTEEIRLHEKDNDELLLDLVKNHPCLYDRDSKEFHDNLLKESAMEDIDFGMKDTVPNCEKRWTDLKNTYQKEKIISEKLSTSGSGANDRKKWPFFEKMHELMTRNAPPRKTLTNLSCESGKQSKIKVRSAIKKSKKVNPIHSALHNVQATVDLVKDALRQDNTEVVQINNDPDELFCKTIEAELNLLTPKTVRQKSKLIMSSLIESDTDEG